MELTDAGRTEKNAYYREKRRVLTEEQKARQREYSRRYRQKHPDRVRESNIKYWNNQAARAGAAARLEALGNAGTHGQDVKKILAERAAQLKDEHQTSNGKEVETDD